MNALTFETCVSDYHKLIGIIVTQKETFFRVTMLKKMVRSTFAEGKSKTKFTAVTKIFIMKSLKKNSESIYLFSARF